GRLFLARLYSNYGLDHEAIRLAYTVRRDAEQAGIKRISHELLPLLYPVKYVQSIIESGLEPAFLLAVIRQESYFNPRALSPANAMGLMQIIPRTGSLLAKDLQMAEYNLYDPDVSLKFGTKYLKDQVDRFDCLPLALAAYNGGPVNVIRWLNRDPASELDEFIELIPFDETRDYVKNVLLQKEIYTHLINAGDLP
ncbi:MAG: lytic transglycosylase domain-containing protein, partial [candidate division WOR-3 bacterium]